MDHGAADSDVTENTRRLTQTESAPTAADGDSED